MSVDLQRTNHATAMPGPDSVNAESIDYQIMKERWELPHDLMGGTLSMRARKTKWLPQEEKESEKAYNNRLNKTILYNAYRRSIKALVGSAFTKPVGVSNLPADLEYLRKDCDSTGRSLTDFCADLCEDILVYGKGHIYTDYPPVHGEVTLADARDLNLRPYFNQVHPKSLVGWDTERRGGTDVLSEIRFRERSVERGDDWQENIVFRVRVVKPGEFSVYKYNAPVMGAAGGVTAAFEEEDVGINTLGYIPLEVIYAKKEAPLVSYPPLEDLAWLNLRHWQSSSDQNHILHIARVPLLFGSGVEDGAWDGAEVGPNRMLIATSPDADLKYVEHTGQAIGAGRTDLLDLENRMSAMGADILTKKSVSRQTATARQIDRSESMSTFQVILRNMEHSIEKAIITAGDWMGIDATGVEVRIGEDMDLPSGESNIVDELVMMVEKGLLTEEGMEAELKRRGIISENTEIFKMKEPEPIIQPPNIEEDGISEELNEPGEE